MARNLAFKLIFDLVASPEPDSMVAGKLVYIAANSMIPARFNLAIGVQLEPSNLMLHRPFLTYRHLRSSQLVL
ncbi:hypothetical protein C8J56DRAFT_1032798 [Mycena floridula]|nr:hypothetical protein C8J56DRAFT_1032798 [Mycena floridula]